MLSDARAVGEVCPRELSCSQDRERLESAATKACGEPKCLDGCWGEDSDRQRITGAVGPKTGCACLLSLSLFQPLGGGTFDFRGRVKRFHFPPQRQESVASLLI